MRNKARRILMYIVIFILIFFAVKTVMAIFGLSKGCTDDVYIYPNSEFKGNIVSISDIDGNNNGVYEIWAAVFTVPLSENQSLEWLSMNDDRYFITILDPNLSGTCYVNSSTLTVGEMYTAKFKNWSELTSGGIIRQSTNASFRVHVIPFEIPDMAAFSPAGSSRSIHLSWTATSLTNTTLDHYDIYRAEADSITLYQTSVIPHNGPNNYIEWKAGTDAVIIKHDLSPASTTYIDTTGVGGKEYYYAVIGIEGDSRIVAMSQSAQLTHPDTGFSLMSPSDDGVLTDLTPLLDWEDVTGATFTLWYGIDPTFSVKTEITGLTSSEYTIPADLLNHGTYYWRVQGNGGSFPEPTWANEGSWRFHTNSSNISPAIFSLISPLGGVKLATAQPTLSWERSDDPSDVVSYTLWYGTDETYAVKTEVAGLSGQAYTPGDTLQNGGTYYWKVKAVDSSGFEVWSSNSGEFQVWISAPKPFLRLSPWLGWDTGLYLDFPENTPPLSTGLRQEGLRPILDWEDAVNFPDAQSITYEVWIDTLVDFSTKTVISGLASSEYTFTTDLDENRFYFWKVKAVNEESQEIWNIGVRPWVFVTNSENEDPGIFSLTAPADEDTIYTCYPTFDWSPSTDPDRLDYLQYQIWYGMDNTFEKGRIKASYNQKITYYTVQPTESKWHLSDLNAYSGNSWWCGDASYSTYADAYFQWLRSEPIDLTDAEAPITLTFKHYYKTEDGFDGGNVRIWDDQSKFFHTLSPSVGSYDTDSLVAFSWMGEFPKQAGYTGESGAWMDASYDLSAFAGRQIILQFVFASDPHITDKGWFIDNIKIEDANSNVYLYDDGGDTQSELYGATSEFISGLTYYWKMKAIDLQYDYLGGETWNEPSFRSFTIAPENNYSVTGYVDLLNTANDSGATVIFAAISESAVSDTAFTDVSGDYNFFEMEPGYYKVTYKKTGWITQIVDSVEVNKNKTLATIYLMNEKATISGFVYLDGATEHDAIRISFKSLATNILYTTYSNTSGYYQIFDLPRGNYQFYDDYPGFLMSRFDTVSISLDSTYAGFTKNKGLSGGYDRPLQKKYSPYIVYGNTSISKIESGVEIRFDGFYDMTVDSALGAPGDSIRFTSNKPSPAPGDHGRIYGGKLFQYCIFEYGKSVTEGVSTPKAAVQIEKQSTVRHCLFRNNGPLHLTIGYWGDSVSVDTCTFNGISTSRGIYIDEGSDHRICGCSFNQMLSGIGSGSLISGEIIHNEFQNLSWGIATGSGNMRISNNTFYQCSTRGILSGQGLIEKNVFDETVVSIEIKGNADVINNTFYSNTSCIFLHGGDNLIQNNIFTHSSANVFLDNVQNDLSGMTFQHNNLWNNAGSLPGGIGVRTTVNSNGDSCDADYNIKYNPMFADSANSDFHLTYTSACIDAGNPGSPEDADGTTVDMGAYALMHYNETHTVNSGSSVTFNDAGSGEGDGHHVNMVFSSMTGTGDITVNQFNQSPSNPPSDQALACIWTISKAGGITAFQSQVTFYYTDLDVSGLNESKLGVFRWNGGEWDGLGGTVNQGDNQVTVTLSDFSVFALMEQTDVLVKAKVFLEGSYQAGGSMSTTLRENNYIPTTSPYSDSRSVESVPAGVVDWVLIELRSTPDGVAVSSRSFFLKSNGLIVETDGMTADLVMPNVTTGNYYIVVRHRNHLAVISDETHSLSSSSATLYDFSTGMDKYGGGNAALLETGVYGMYSGDTNGSGIVTNSDKDSIISNLNSAGYYNADANVSGIVTNSDKDKIIQNLNKATAVE